MTEETCEGNVLRLCQNG